MFGDDLVRDEDDLVAALALQRTGDAVGPVVQLAHSLLHPAAFFLVHIAVVVDHVRDHRLADSGQAGHILAGDLLEFRFHAATSFI